MRIAVIGGGGVRTPLIVRELVRRQDRLGLDDVALMDEDPRRLEAMAAVSAAVAGESQARFRTRTTTDLPSALAGADFVLTTFRVGGLEARAIDERVALNHGLVGQETTGAGGFAMGLRSIPVVLALAATMRRECPEAWLINFANPSGMLAEAAQRAGSWSRTVGICDGPASIQSFAAGLLGVEPDEIFLDYFGLNHLGWVRAVFHHGEDYLPQFLAMARAAGRVPGLPFDPEFVAALGMIPHEYLYYYYHTSRAVEAQLEGGQTRGEFLLQLNRDLFADLASLIADGEPDAIRARYRAYLSTRAYTYPGNRGLVHAADEAPQPQPSEAEASGYARVALDLIEALSGAGNRRLILNIPNRGAISGMAPDEVVEVPALVERQIIRPLAVGGVPDHALGLMKRVKEYERLTIEAAVDGSYARALQALAIHPLVSDFDKAKAVLDEYRERLGPLLPVLR